MPQNKKKPGDDLLSHHEGSTIGVRELNFRVRNGNGCGLSTIITGQCLLHYRKFKGFLALLQAALLAGSRSKRAPEARMGTSVCCGSTYAQVRGERIELTIIWSSLTED